MFDVQRFTEQCQAALKESDPAKAIRETVERTVSAPSEVLKGLGEPQRATVQRLHVADDLTIINVIWGPHMTIMPHNHKIPAIIGVYTGAEDNIFWRRTGDSSGLIKAAGARSLREKDVEALGADAIHSVTNPILRLTGAIHVYRKKRARRRSTTAITRISSRASGRSCTERVRSRSVTDAARVGVSAGRTTHARRAFGA